jgi:GNAT superfamily N-acetyltransferase
VTRLIEAASEAERAQARTLFRAYADQLADELGVDLGFQSFERELAELGQIYSPPGGCLLLALAPAGAGEAAVGCVGVRRLDDEVCEMKRLYVAPAERGSGLGRRLAQASVEAGRRLGYRRMVLDTLTALGPALALYRSMGFVETPAYYANPLAGVVYLGLALDQGSSH